MQTLNDAGTGHKSPFWKRYFLGIVGILALCVLAALWLGYSYLLSKHRIVAVSVLREQLLALKRLESILKLGEVPYNWDAGTYLPYAPINKVFEELCSAKLQVTKELVPDSDIEILIRKLTLDGGDANAEATIEIEAKSPSHNVSLILQGSALIFFREITPSTPEGTRSARFAVKLLELHPKTNRENFDFLIGKASILLTSPIIEKLNAELEKRMTLGIPFACPSGVSLGFNVSNTFDVGKAKAAVSVTMPGKEVPLPVESGTAVFTHEGVWILTSGKPAYDLTNEPPDNTRQTEEELRNEIASMRRSLAPALKRVLQPKSTATGWLNQRTVAKFIADYMALPAESRTVTAILQKCDGTVAEDKWRDNVLGEGGVAVSIPNPSSVVVTAMVEGGTTKWLPNEGLSYNIPVNGRGQGSIHVHVDPLVGGGAGTDAGISGPASAIVSGLFKLQQTKISGHKVVYVDPGTVASPLTAKVETDGKFVVDWGWTKVPKVGATIGVSLPSTIVPAMPLLDDMPLRSVAIEEEMAKAGLALGDKTVKYIQFRFEPEGVQVADQGFIMRSPLLLELTSTALNMDSVASSRKKIRDDIMSEQRRSAPGPSKETSIKIHIGPFEFGPNNDIVAFLRACKKEVGEIVGMMKKAGREVSPEKVEEWAKTPSESLKRSDIGKTWEALFPKSDDPGSTINIPIVNIKVPNPFKRKW